MRDSTRIQLEATLHSIRNRKDDYQLLVDEQGSKWCAIDLIGLSPEARKRRGYPMFDENNKVVNGIAILQVLPSETYNVD
jgi:hypothetical protein